MKCGVIDIGSNSMRLTVYDAERNTFRILFKEKIMTALASYVEYGALSEEGIESACSGLMEFRERLEVLEIRDIYVFATASLRNITNTEDALNQIYAKTGFAVEVISGYEEALYGFSGAMCDVAATDGIFTPYSTERNRSTTTSPSLWLIFTPRDSGDFPRIVSVMPETSE